MERLDEEQDSEAHDERSVEVVSEYGESQERFGDEEPHAVIQTLGRCKHFSLTERHGRA